MKERPILFSGPMVRALLDGSKTQTRRVVKPAGAHHLFQFRGEDAARGADEPTGEWAWCRAEHVVSDHIRCPHGKPGDRLWVRESLAPTRDDNGIVVDWHYAADGAKVPRMPGLIPDFNDAMAFAHLARPSAVPSIHMPRWASRITLEVTGVRVERLQDISEADARAEGVTIEDRHMNGYCAGETRPPSIRAFRDLWESISGAESWAANPWVWVVEFKRVT